MHEIKKIKNVDEWRKFTVAHSFSLRSDILSDIYFVRSEDNYQILRKTDGGDFQLPEVSLYTQSDTQILALKFKQSSSALLYFA